MQIIGKNKLNKKPKKQRKKDENDIIANHSDSVPDYVSKSTEPLKSFQTETNKSLIT